jgi:signal transduction histidine kinase
VATDALDDDRLRRLLAAGQALAARLDLDELLEELLRTACEVTGARFAALGVLDEERRALERFLTRGIGEEEHRRIGSLPRGRGVLGVLIDDPRPLRLDDVAAHPASFGFPPHHPPMTTFLGVPIRIRGQAWGNLYLTERDGGPFTPADEQAAIVLADWAAIGVENARLLGAARDRQAEAERALRRLDATTDVVRAVGTELDTRTVLRLVVERGRALAGARAVVLLLREGPDLVVADAAGQVAASARGARVAEGESALGALAAPRRLHDVQAQLALADQALGVVGAETALLVPLRYRDRRLGVLAAFDRLGDVAEFGDEDEALLEAFATSAATAVATARTVEEERLRRSLEAAEAERARWARELHDDTLQALGALRIVLAGAARQDDDAKLRAAVGTAVAQLEDDIRSLRALITELRPAALDELGLQAAVASLAERLGAVMGVPVHADVEDVGRLPPTVETTVYRVVQEALSNATRHAGASRVEVRVRRDDGAVALEVVDDGGGFDPAAGSRGFGLPGMRERVALAGGALELDSAPGRGTAVRATVPL